MPMLSFRTADGRVEERFYWPTEECPERIILDDGTVAERSFTDELRGSPRPAVYGKWPLRSRALGVHPNQIREALRRYPDRVYDRLTGEQIFESSRQRKRVLKQAHC